MCRRSARANNFAEDSSFSYRQIKKDASATLGRSTLHLSALPDFQQARRTGWPFSPLLPSSTEVIAELCAQVVSLSRLSIDSPDLHRYTLEISVKERTKENAEGS